mgnify:CR=1 FL=1
MLHVLIFLVLILMITGMSTSKYGYLGAYYTVGVGWRWIDGSTSVYWTPPAPNIVSKSSTDVAVMQLSAGTVHDIADKALTRPIICEKQASK